MVKLYGKIIEFQNMQHGMVQKQVFQQVGLEPIVNHLVVQDCDWLVTGLIVRLVTGLIARHLSSNRSYIIR